MGEKLPKYFVRIFRTSLFQVSLSFTKILCKVHHCNMKVQHRLFIYSVIIDLSIVQVEKNKKWLLKLYSKQKSFIVAYFLSEYFKTIFDFWSEYFDRKIQNFGFCPKLLRSEFYPTPCNGKCILKFKSFSSYSVAPLLCM